MEEKEITVQELIDLLNKIPNKDCPIDICRQGCYGKDPERHCIVPTIRQYRSDVLGEVRAYSIEAIRRKKFNIECDIVDGFEPITLEDCEDELDDLDEEGKETVLKAINLRRQNIQRERNADSKRRKMLETASLD